MLNNNINGRTEYTTPKTVYPKFKAVFGLLSNKAFINNRNAQTNITEKKASVGINKK